MMGKWSLKSMIYFPIEKINKIPCSITKEATEITVHSVVKKQLRTLTCGCVHNLSSGDLHYLADGIKILISDIKGL